jgi:hypothetical protein
MRHAARLALTHKQLSDDFVTALTLINDTALNVCEIEVLITACHLFAALTGQYPEAR